MYKNELQGIVTAPPTYCVLQDEVFYDWINPVYLNPGSLGDIQDKFETESEIELQDFIQVNQVVYNPNNIFCYIF